MKSLRPLRPEHDARKVAAVHVQRWIISMSLRAIPGSTRSQRCQDRTWCAKCRFDVFQTCSNLLGEVVPKSPNVKQPIRDMLKPGDIGGPKQPKSEPFEAKQHVKRQKVSVARVFQRFVQEGKCQGITCRPKKMTTKIDPNCMVGNSIGFSTKNRPANLSLVFF